MDDSVVYTQQLPYPAVMGQLYHSVCRGERLSDHIVSNVVVYLRRQLESWTVSHNDDMLHARDDILLSLSTLLLAVKKKLCASEHLLDRMKDADFSLIVSKLCCITRYSVLHD